MVTAAAVAADSGYIICHHSTHHCRTLTEQARAPTWARLLLTFTSVLVLSSVAKWEAQASIP